MPEPPFTLMLASLDIDHTPSGIGNASRDKQKSRQPAKGSAAQAQIHLRITLIIAQIWVSTHIEAAAVTVRRLVK